MGFPFCLMLSGEEGGIKAEQGCYQGPAEELSEIKEEVVKKWSKATAFLPGIQHTHMHTHTHFLRSA